VTAALARGALRLPPLPALSLALSLMLLLSACATAPREQAGRSVGALRLIGEQRIALRQPYAGTLVGGLSGIDYDPHSGSWIAESDDRSETGPARFYTLRLRYDEQAFSSVELTGVHVFRQADGSAYPGPAVGGGEVPDIETIRYDPRDASIWYASEGSRKLGLNPFVRHARADGAYLETLATPAMFRVSAQETGSRNNLSFEGLSFAPDGESLWLGMEAPLYQDGPLATPEHGAVSRITRLGRSGQVLAQFAYPLDPVQARPAPGRFSDNGMSELLAIDGRRLLALERSGVQDAAGVFAFYIRLYRLDTAGASDVRDVTALQGAQYAPVSKRLLLDLNALGLPRVDNLEGIAWGPRLPNGHDTLVLVSDDNFSDTQVTQFLAFEVLPAPAGEEKK
jgi:hypothetical protein